MTEKRGGVREEKNKTFSDPNQELLSGCSLYKRGKEKGKPGKKEEKRSWSGLGRKS